jgi:formylglycine-generating enzyme required for sulfatase activity
MLMKIHPAALVALTLAALMIFVPAVIAPGPPVFVIESRTGMKLALIPAGTFTMGSPESQPGRNSDETPHTVSISNAFYLGIHEVTQTQWAMVMSTTPSHFTACGQCPVERVSFYDVDRFLAGLSANATFLRFRLPTESEWEYACRAGEKTPAAPEPLPTATDANIDDRTGASRATANRFRGSTAHVGSYPPNRWGLFDMHGNVWEWVNDWYGEYPADDVVDPRGAAQGARRVIRGGSWYFDENSARCALRYTHLPQDSGFSLGFRVAADPIRREP